MLYSFFQQTVAFASFLQAALVVERAEIGQEPGVARTLIQRQKKLPLCRLQISPQYKKPPQVVTGGGPLIGGDLLTQFRQQRDTLALINSGKIAGTARRHILLVGKAARHTGLENSGVAVDLSHARELAFFRGLAPQGNVRDQTSAEQRDDEQGGCKNRTEALKPLPQIGPGRDSLTIPLLLPPDNLAGPRSRLLSERQ